MNDYTLQDLQLGMKESFSVAVTEEMMQKFREISGDINPLHTDKRYACENGYPDRVVYGMLTASFYSTLAGVYLPGERCLLWKVNTKFKSPVFVGDKLNVCGIVEEIDERFGCIQIKAQIRNQNGKLISLADITAGLRGEGERLNGK